MGNGSVTDFSGSRARYTAEITPADTGTVTVDVAAHLATDAIGNPNLPAKRYSVQARLNTPPVITAPGDKSYEQGRGDHGLRHFGLRRRRRRHIGVAVGACHRGCPTPPTRCPEPWPTTPPRRTTPVTIEADDGVNAAVDRDLHRHRDGGRGAKRPAGDHRARRQELRAGRADHGLRHLGLRRRRRRRNGGRCRACHRGCPTPRTRCPARWPTTPTAKDYTVTIEADDGGEPGGGGDVHDHGDRGGGGRKTRRR